MASITYKHKKSGQTATYGQPMPKLEKSDDWEREGAKKKPAAKKPADPEPDES